jgi:hypothetical protein
MCHDRLLSGRKPPMTAYSRPSGSCSKRRGVHAFSLLPEARAANLKKSGHLRLLWRFWLYGTNTASLAGEKEERLGGVCRPLMVIGKGAAYSQADSALRGLTQKLGIPFLATAMGRGVVPDNAPGSVNAARSMALAQADVALIFGARCRSSSPVTFIPFAIVPSSCSLPNVQSQHLHAAGCNRMPC